MAPFGDLGVVAAEEDVGDAPAAEFDGAGVLGEFEEAGGVAVVGGALVVAEDSGEQAGDGVDDDGGGEGAVGEDVVADGKFAVDEVVDDALIDAFVVAAEEDEVGDFDELLGGALGEEGAGGGEEEGEGFSIFDFRFSSGVAGSCGGAFPISDLRTSIFAQLFDRGEDGFAFEDHALAAAVGGVVGGAVFVGGPVAEVVGADGDEAALLRLADHALGERGGGDVWEEGEDVDQHLGFSIEDLGFKKCAVAG